MDQTTLRRARWWILGLVVLVAVGVVLTVTSAGSGNDDKVDPDTTTTSMYNPTDEVRQATRLELDQ